MSNVLVNPSTLEGLGRVIRLKNNSEEKIKPSVMPDDVAAFELADCPDIEKIIARTIKSYTNTTITSVSNYLFAGCKYLTEINLPAATTIGASSFYKSGLKTLSSNSLIEFGDSAFSFSKLEEVACENVTTVGKNCFDNCKCLSTVNLPKLAVVAAYSFQSSSIKKVKFNSVTQIGGNAFNSSSLQHIDLPAATEILGAGFYNCKYLDTVILRKSSVCSLGNKNAFGSTPIESGSGYIYVPKSLISSYKTATNWSNFSEQFRAIEDYADQL